MTTASLSYPLAMARTGETVRIVGLAGGRNLDRRLSDLGLAIGCAIRVVQNQMTGPMIVAVHQSRIGLGMGMAQKMTVEPVDE
ncbi:MAG: ferrous iron transport protein A [Rhizobium sp.]|nr:ferrous iron transport protein A [Rhizobium sp.]